MGICSIVGSIAIKLCLAGEENISMQAEVCMKPMAEFQPPTRISSFSFKMLNSLDVAWM
jgi:hypothetical protein